MPEITPPGASTLGRRLDEARLEAGYSLRDLAKRAEVTTSMMNRLLKDEVDRPSPAILARVTSVLGLSLAQVFKLARYPYPSVDDLLRTDHGLTEEAIATIRDAIDEHESRKGAA
mgnify:CR=1 FL=1